MLKLYLFCILVLLQVYLSLETHLSNYASVECGAHIVKANPEASTTSAILSEARDQYLLSPCGKTWFIIELCEEVGINQIEIGNLEYFSSNFKHFKVFGLTSNEIGKEEWINLGNFTALNTKEIQKFSLTKPAFYQHIMINITSSYGDEYYCPITQVKVRGLTLFQSLKDELREVPFQREESTDYFADSIHQSFEQEPLISSNNLTFKNNNSLMDFFAEVFEENSTKIDPIPPLKKPLPSMYCSPEIPILETCFPDYYTVVFVEHPQNNNKPNENVLKTLAHKVRTLELNQTTNKQELLHIIQHLYKKLQETEQKLIQSDEIILSLNKKIEAQFFELIRIDVLESSFQKFPLIELQLNGLWMFIIFFGFYQISQYFASKELVGQIPLNLKLSSMKKSMSTGNISGESERD